ncbi:50S ribosomal protein L10 [bacterium]|nr:50S ribosomal protein L10 [bacterium]
MPSVINQRMVTELATELRAMPQALLVDYSGLSAEQSNELRTLLDEQGARMLVVKNSLTVLALRQLDLPDVADLIDGPTALVHGEGDPAHLAKTVLDWGKKAKLLTLRGGVLDGTALDAAGAQALAALPPLLVLRAMVVGVIAAPLTRFVGSLQEIVRSFVGVIQAIAEKDESQ